MADSDQPGSEQMNGPTPASAMAVEGTSTGQTGDRPWERAWTVDEMRKGANTWSLASDAGMLQYLQGFSHKMIKRTHDMQEEVNNLLHEAKLTGVRVNNTFNDFIVLANTQFVENRVYDEDVSQAAVAEESKPEQKEKTKGEKEAEIVPRISEAMRLGLEVLDSAFEKLDVNEANSDSEEEDTPYNADPLLEPKDPYLHRALPYIIGSQPFLQDDDVGLVDMPEEEESDHGSISETESEAESESEAETEPLHRPATKQQVFDSDTESESESESGSDLFGQEKPARDDFDDTESETGSETESESGEEEDAQRKSAGPADFAAELAAKIGSAPVQQRAPSEESEHHTKKKGHAKSKEVEDKKEEKRTSKKSKSKSRSSTTVEDDDLFAPPVNQDEYEDDDSPFGRKGGLFSGGGGLFDDEGGGGGGLFDDVVKETKPKVKDTKPKKQQAIIQDEEEESEEEEAPKPEVKKAVTKKPSGGVSLFAGGVEDDLFSTAAPKKVDKKTIKPKPAPAAGGLFDGDDEEEDLFASMASAKPNSKKATPAAKSTKSSLFNDDEEEGDLFGDAPVVAPPTIVEPKKEPKKHRDAKPDKKLPPGAVSLFGNVPNPMVAALKGPPPPQSDSEGSEAWSEEDKSTKSSASFHSASNQNAAKKDRSPSVSSSSLFAEEPEDLFAGAASAKPKQVEVKGESKSKPPTTGMFEDDDEEEDLFASVSKPKSSADSKPRAKSGSLLFEDEAEQDLFAASAVPATSVAKAEDSGKKKKPPVGGVSLFGGADLFGGASEKSQKQQEKAKVPEKKPEPAKPKKSTLSLFDDEEEDAGDLFGASGSVTREVEAPASLDFGAAKPGKSRSRTKSKSLFEDEDVLFGAREDDPSVDLFGSQSPVSPTKSKKFPAPEPAASHQAAPPKTKATIGGATVGSSSTDMFDDDDEEDLFASSGRKSNVPADKVKVAGVTTTEISTDQDVAVPDKPQDEEEVVKPKKLAGAVSMFGGLDPSTLLKKKGSQPDKPAPSVKPQVTSKPKPAVAARTDKAKPVDPLFGASADDDDMFAASKQPKTPEKNSTAGGAPSARGHKSAVGKLQSNLAINPAALLPGAAPPVKEPEPVAASFDQPAQVETLHHVAKDRAKIQTKRRPPSRKVLKGGASSQTTTDSTVSPPVVNSVSPPLASRVGVQPESAEKKVDPLDNVVPVARPRKTDDLFVDDSPDGATEDIFGVSSDLQKKSQGAVDILGTVRTKGTPSGKPDDLARSPDDLPTSKVNNIPQNDFFSSSTAPTIKARSPPADSLFGSKPVSIKPVTPPTTVEKTESRDSAPSMFSVSKPKWKPVRGPMSASDDDDIFANSKVSVKSEAPPPVESNVTEKAPPPGGDDDIFASKVSVKSVAPPMDKKEVPVKMSPPPDDDDDIFANSKVSIKPEAPPTDKKEPIKKATPPPDDDDIFADSSLLVKKEAPPPQQKAPPSNDDDDDDIFADASINKKSSTTKKASTVPDDGDIFTTPPTSNQKTPVEDDDDDIFATAPRSATRRPKKAITKEENLFNDDTDIFSTPSQKPKEKVVKKKASSEKPLFKGDVDDIFADSASKAKPKKTTTKKKSTKASAAKKADIFDDDAPNIFDDPLNALGN